MNLKRALTFTVTVMFVLTALVIMCFTALPAFSQNAPRRPSILFINTQFFRYENKDVLDETYLENIKSLGYRVDLVKMQDLTKEKLYEFNVAVVMGPVDPLDSYAVSIFDKITPMLRDYLNDGGGVLYNDHSSGYMQDKQKQSVSIKFLEPYGLTPLLETVWNEKDSFRQKKYMQEYFLNITNIDKNVITRDINKIIIPIYGYETTTFKVNDDWKILASGDVTTISTPTPHPNPSRTIEPGMYKSSPPLFAVRTVGNGRLAYTSISSFYTFHSGNHLIYEGLVLKEGNLFKLLMNTYNWLAGSSRRNPHIGTFSGSSYSPPPPPKIDYTDVRVYPVDRDIPTNLEVHLGLLGAHSNLTDGTSDVADYCQRAKKLGYSFLVFTEPLEMMNEAKYKTLVEKCKAASDDTFVALPGIEYTDLHPAGQQNRHIITYMLDWFKDEWLSDDKKHTINAPGIEFGNNWPLIGVITPGKNPLTPGILKFWTALAVYTYENGSLVDNSVDEFLKRVKNAYGKPPITYHKILAPSDIPPLGSTYVTGAFVRNVNDLSMEGRSLQHSYHTFVTNGPRIHYAGLSRPPFPKDYLVLREQQWKFYYDVSSDNPIVEIQLWDNTEPIRILKVNNEKRTQGSFTGFQEKQHALTLRVIDSAGKIALSCPYSMHGIRHTLNMCADLQNDGDAGFQVSHSGLIENNWIVGGFITGSAGVGPRLNVPETELFPVGRDSYSRTHGGKADYTIFVEGEGGEWGNSYFDHYFASEECTIVDQWADHTTLPGSKFALSRFCNSKSRYYSFTPRLYDWNLLLIEDEIEVLKDLTLANGYPHSPKLISLMYGVGNLGSFDFYAYRNAGGEVNTDRWRKDGELLEGRPITNMVIPPGGYIGLYPDFYGCLVVYPLDKEVEASLWNPYLGFGYGKGGEELKKGDTFSYRFLSALKWETKGQEDFEMLARVYNLDGKNPSYKVTTTNGTVADTVYALTLQASDYNARCTITKNPEMPTDLPLILKGINERWNVSLYDYDTGTIKRVGAIDGAAYSQMDINERDRNIFFGNSLTCDNDDVWLKLMEVKGTEPGEDKTAVVELHNPTDSTLAIILTSPLFGFEEKVNINSKTIKIIEVPLPEWKDKRITIYTNELTNQVKKFILKEN